MATVAASPEIASLFSKLSLDGEGPARAAGSPVAPTRTRARAASAGPREGAVRAAAPPAPGSATGEGGCRVRAQCGGQGPATGCASAGNVPRPSRRHRLVNRGAAPQDAPAPARGPGHMAVHAPAPVLPTAQARWARLHQGPSCPPGLGAARHTPCAQPPPPPPPLAPSPRTGDRAAAAGELATAVKGAGITSLSTSGALAKLTAALDDKDAGAREGALLAIAALAESVGRPAEPYLMPLLAPVLNALADKATPVRAAAVRAQGALDALLNPHGIAAVLPMLFDAMLAQKWQTNEGACKLLSALADRAPRQVAHNLPEIVPKVTEAMGNARQAVKDAAVEAMTKCMNVVGNRDIEVRGALGARGAGWAGRLAGWPVQAAGRWAPSQRAPRPVPRATACCRAAPIASAPRHPLPSVPPPPLPPPGVHPHPGQLPAEPGDRARHHPRAGVHHVRADRGGAHAVHHGAAPGRAPVGGTPEQAVARRRAGCSQEARPLTRTRLRLPRPQVPLLVRGLRQDNTTAIKRKTALIIDNMAKLVDNPLDAVPFLPKLLPGGGGARGGGVFARGWGGGGHGRGWASGWGMVESSRHLAGDVLPRP